MGQPVVHDFREDLQFSHDASDYSFWLDCYRLAFPSLVGCHDHRADSDQQRLGIDRTLVLDNGKVIYIDEKIRREHYTNQSPQGDILLEEWSDVDRRIPGWVTKRLWSDYIAYAILPIQTCYLLPVLQLQEAWRRFEQRWKGSYRKCAAQNKGYTTVGWAVPIPVLYGAIGGCLRVKWTQ